MAKTTSKMVKYPVLEVFRDKETMKKYPVGSEYETDDMDRAAYLQEFGYVGKPQEEASQGEPPKDDKTNDPNSTPPKDDKTDDSNVTPAKDSDNTNVAKAKE
ncbi:hypothetical protein ACFCW7_09220 [Paenibacillus glucanolyticus]|uniref:hypothetical protein n=1 Tax=Paenibacillus glucanolyticus TaxID=59843 RepID=UPI0035DEF2DA